MSGFSRPLIVLSTLLGLILPAYSPATAKPETHGPHYVLLPKLRLGVQIDANRQFRMLELETWLSYDDAAAADRAGRARASVGEAMKEDFLGYNWEDFADPVGGPELARTIVQNSVHRVLPDISEKAVVLIRGMTLR